jgi:hypothetical protein
MVFLVKLDDSLLFDELDWLFVCVGVGFAVASSK